MYLLREKTPDGRSCAAAYDVAGPLSIQHDRRDDGILRRGFPGPTNRRKPQSSGSSHPQVALRQAPHPSFLCRTFSKEQATRKIADWSTSFAFFSAEQRRIWRCRYRISSSRQERSERASADSSICSTAHRGSDGPHALNRVTTAVATRRPREGAG